MIEDVDQARAGQPDVLLDRLVFGLSLELQPTVSLPALIDRLVAADVGRLGGPIRAGRASFDVDCAVEDLPDNGVCQIGGRLKLQAEGQRLRVLPGSSLELNGMRLLRTTMDRLAWGELAGDNFVGPHGADWPELFERQAAGLAESVETFVDALADFAGVSRPQQVRLRLRWAEACRDLPVRYAPKLARRVASTWFGGELRVQQNYPSKCAMVGDLPVVSWGAASRTAPVTKIYAKATNLLRTEVTVRRGDAAAQLLTGSRRAAGIDVEADAEQLRDLLRQFGLAAVPLLDEARAAIEAVEAPANFSCDLIFRLAPLIALSEPGQRPGRPISDTTRAAAREVLESLLYSGRASARGVRASTALRRVLDEMATGPDAVLQRQDLRTLYALRPEWAALGRQIALASDLPGAD